MSHRLRELGLGIRLALVGARVATALTAAGVALGVALLLVAASVPAALQHREDRAAARDYRSFVDVAPPASPATLLIAEADTTFRGREVRGRLLRAEGPQAPLPPGVRALPAPGQLVVSPALADLLREGDSGLLRERLGGRVVGTIAASGLIGPDELAYYAGSDSLAAGGATARIEAFGVDGLQRRPLDPVLVLLVIVLFVVTLVPLGVFLTTAVRFGGEQRDRRLAALRLVGADRAMVRRIAAGETLVGALLGLVLGAAAFALARPLVEHVTLWDVSVFAGDLDPSPLLAVLIALLVPATAVAITVVSLQAVAIEPLGVVRRGLGRRRRVLWRLVLPALGLLLLVPLAGTVDASGDQADRYRVAAGAALLLVGVAALLPWLVEALVRRVRGPGVAAQLAIRRLQLSPETSARMVSGVAVAAAGAIALQMLFAGVGDDYRRARSADALPAQVELHGAGAARLGLAGTEAALAAAPGVGAVHVQQLLPIVVPAEGAPPASLLVGTCATLQAAMPLPRCADGDVFVVAVDAPSSETGIPRPGQEVAVGDAGAAGGTAGLPRWTVPAGAVRVSEANGAPASVLATPAAVPVALLQDAVPQAVVELVPGAPDAADELRTAAARIDPTAKVFVPAEAQEDHRFGGIRRGIYLGVAATLALIGASMLVALLESLRERRRSLAVLVAFGTPTRTLGWSVLLQAALPVVLGLALAVGVGVVLGGLLLSMVSRPVTLDGASIAVVCATGAGVVLGVTALGLPALWRLVRPDGLRTE